MHFKPFIKSELIAPSKALVLLLLIIYPLVSSDFFALQIGAYSIILGLVALSLMILGGLGGMMTLSQVTIAGMAGYMIAILGENNLGGVGLSWWFAVMLSVGFATILGGIIGVISIRTEGIYTIMITLAIAIIFFYFTRQNYALFNGFNGFSEIVPPTLFGLYWRDTLPFYYLTLVLGVLAYACVLYMMNTPFGLALQAIRDNPRRMTSLGFNVMLHRLLAHMLAGFIAGLSGVLMVWYMGRISPGDISIDVVIDVLVIAIIGGMRHPIGPFIGAIAFVLLSTFAIDLIDRERFNTLIGLIFLLIVMFSPDGLLGMLKTGWHKMSKTTEKTKEVQTQ